VKRSECGVKRFFYVKNLGKDMSETTTAVAETSAAIATSKAATYVGSGTAGYQLGWGPLIGGFGSLALH
jgi:hypothetical protein